MGKELEEIESIFCDALEKKAPEARVAFLDEACGDNADLRKKIEALLKLHDNAGSFLASPILDPDVLLDNSPLTEGPGTVIDRYKLLERIGEGGMAVVYMAEQSEPISRKVALKIIKLGMDTKSVVARFEAERQALAMMDHPNIAKVLDAGATETGRPYFVMELVAGVSISKYCDENKLSTPRRLDLFVKVCSAVHHAHQKGIIHRDIKPTNVMVTLHDGKPVPKVIDFGIAKAMNQRLTEKTLFTRYGHMVGTPAYMSPEQAEMSGLDIDTRTDVYSLGVLLYELLTGTTPFDAEKLREAGYVEMQRIIHEQEPAKPSTKLSTLGNMLAQIAESRNTKPDLLSRLIRGDLDWIVMKSVEKDRVRRYDTASALAVDVRRHLNHEPILARAPKVTYRLQKLVLRQKSRIAVTLAMAALVAAATITFSTWYQKGLQQEKREQFDDESTLFQAQESFSDGDAFAALEKAESVLNSPHVGLEAKLLYAKILVEGRQSAEAMSQLGDLLHEGPDIAGTASSIMAWMLWEGEPRNTEEWRRLSEYRQRARETLESLLDEAPETAGYASLLLARILLEDGSINEDKLARVDELKLRAEELLPRSAKAYFFRATMALSIKDKLDLLQRALETGPGHYDSRKLRALIHYASRRYSDMELDVETMIALRPQDPLGYSLRAVVSRELGYYERAIKDYDKAVALTAERDPQRAKLCDLLCQLRLRTGDYEQAIADANEGLAHFPNETGLHARIFCALTAQGKYEEAIVWYRRTGNSDPDSRRGFTDLSMRYVFDALAVGRSWHPPQSRPEGPAFLAMLEAEEIYHSLKAKGRPLITDGFAADWSPKGNKLVFCSGVPGNSGVAVLNKETGETNLLIAPGKNPKWSPDGHYIAFVRDRRLLPLSRLVSSENPGQSPSYWNPELWIMKSDGTDPRPLAHGRWPSWSRDSKRLYRQSWKDRMLYSIPIESGGLGQTPVLPFRQPSCSVSPNEQYAAYAYFGSMKIVDVTSGSTVAQWTAPVKLWGGNWDPKSQQFSMGGYSRPEDRTGLWIYDLNRGEARQVLCGQITNAAWAPDGARLAFSLGPPFYDIWEADLDPNVSTIESLGPGRTPEEYCREMADRYTETITSGASDANGYLRRAGYYHGMGDEDRANADMREYAAILKPRMGTDRREVGPEAVSGEGTHVTLIFGTPTPLGPTVNSPACDWDPSISADG
ncbi:MAG: protein kinase domain-containing protein, partial [Planctomycetota bacterium]